MLSFWQLFNSVSVLILVIILLGIAFMLYKFKLLYILKFLKSNDRTKIKIFKKSNQTKNQLTDQTMGFYRKQSTRIEGDKPEDFSSSSSVEKETVIDRSCKNHPDPINEICLVENCPSHISYDGDSEARFLSSVQKARAGLGRKPVTH